MRGMNVIAGGGGKHEPEPILIEIVVSPVEVRLTVRVHVREVGVAIRIDPLLRPTSSMPPSVEFSLDCILFGAYIISSPILDTK